MASQAASPQESGQRLIESGIGFRAIAATRVVHIDDQEHTGRLPKPAVNPPATLREGSLGLASRHAAGIVAPRHYDRCAVRSDIQTRSQ
jgi:hypothetical protein